MCHDFEICTNAFNGWCMLYVKIEELKKKREHCSTERMDIYIQIRSGSLGTCFNFIFQRIVDLHSKFSTRIAPIRSAGFPWKCGTWHQTKPNKNKFISCYIQTYVCTYPHSPHVHMLDFPYLVGFSDRASVLHS